MEKEVLTEQELAAKFGIDLKPLVQEQIKLAKQLKLKDAIKLEDIKLIAGCDNSYYNNQIISAIVILDAGMQVVEEKFVVQKAAFPYIPGFLAYRELPAMLACYEKLQESPDVLIVDGNGILHPRKLGIASHFGLAIGKPTIGIAKNLLLGEVKNGKVYVDSEVMGAELITRPGSRPIYVSPGHLITLESAVELVKKCIREPHKLPEPLDASHRYADRIKAELMK